VGHIIDLPVDFGKNVVSYIRFYLLRTPLWLRGFAQKRGEALGSSRRPEYPFPTISLSFLIGAGTLSLFS
jgi:hypothetical protein